MTSSLSSRRQYRARGSLEKMMLCVGLKPYARRAIGPGSCTEESLIEQKNVERDDEEDYDRRNGRGEPVIDERAHNVPVAAEDEQRNERERDAEGEHHLAYDKRTAGVEAYGQDDQGRHHGNEAAQEQRYLPAYEPLHDDLPTQGPHRRARQPGGEQGDPEQDGRSVALEYAQLLESLVYVADACQPGRVEEGCSHDEHARVDCPGDGHGDDHIYQLETEDLALLLFGLAYYPALREGRVQVDDMRHYRGAEDSGRQQHALGPRESGRKKPGEYPIRF